MFAAALKWATSMAQFGWRWPAIVVVSAAMVLLVSPTPNVAALWVRISTGPERPIAGEPATVSVQTFQVIGADCLDDPDAQATPMEAYEPGSSFVLDAMELRAIAPADAESFSFEVTRRADDPTIWDGEVVFPVGGLWKLRLIQPSFSPSTPMECIGAEVDVTVLRWQGEVVPTPTEEPEPTPTTTPGPIFAPTVVGAGSEADGDDDNDVVLFGALALGLLVVAGAGTVLFMRARHTNRT